MKIDLKELQNIVFTLCLSSLSLPLCLSPTHFISLSQSLSHSLTHSVSLFESVSVSISFTISPPFLFSLYEHFHSCFHKVLRVNLEIKEKFYVTKNTPPSHIELKFYYNAKILISATVLNFNRIDKLY